MNFLNYRRRSDPSAVEARDDWALPDNRDTLAEHDRILRDTYERGRRDERARHPRGGHPFLASLLLLTAVAGAFVIYLGVRQGSFAGGGQMVDQGIANATASAQQASRDAADRAGDALQNAGQRLKQTRGNG